MIYLNQISNIIYIGSVILKLQLLLSDAPFCSGYCCLHLPQAVTSQAGHIKQTRGPFYSLVHIENEKNHQFCNLLTLLSLNAHDFGVSFRFENPACDVTAL